MIEEILPILPITIPQEKFVGLIYINVPTHLDPIVGFVLPIILYIYRLFF